MKIEADAKLVTIYVNSTDQWHGQPLYSAIVAALQGPGHRRGDGGPLRGRLWRQRPSAHGAALELSENLPVRIEIVDIAERIEPLLPLLEPMIGEGLLTILDVRIRRYLHDPKK